MLSCSLGEISSSGPARWKQVLFSSWESALEGQRRNSLSISIKRSPSGANAGLAATIARIPPCAGAQRLLLEPGLPAATHPGLKDFPAPSSSSKYRKILSYLVCQELDSRIVSVGRAAKVQCNPDTGEQEEDRAQVCSKSKGDGLCLGIFSVFPPGRIVPFKLQVWESFQCISFSAGRLKKFF